MKRSRSALQALGLGPSRSAGPMRTWFASLAVWASLGIGCMAWADEIPVDHAPVFLLSGAAPNLILTLDDSNSMTAGNADSDDRVVPQFDARDTSAISNSLYYDPAIVYLPPVDAGGKSFPHADFASAPRDFFKNVVASDRSVDCRLDLRSQYAPLWDENRPPCTEIADGAIGAGDTNNEYTIDWGHPVFRAYRKYLADLGRYTTNAHKEAAAAAWAKYCIYGTALEGEVSDEEDADTEADEEQVRCPAFYYAWDSRKSYAVGASCASLDPLHLSASDAAAALPQCLNRIVVGSKEERTLTSAAIHAERSEKLRGAGGAEAALDETDLAERNFANWYVFHRNRWRALQTAIAQVASTLDPTVRVGYQRLVAGAVDTDNDMYRNELVPSFGAFNETRRQAFQDWLFGRRPNAGTYLLSSALRVETFCGQDIAYLRDPARNGGDDNPLLGCRNNFHLIFTDGMWEDAYGAAVSNIPNGSAPGNADGTTIGLPAERAYANTFSPAITQYDSGSLATRIFADANIGGLADIVFRSWVTDLRPDLDATIHRVRELVPEEIQVSGQPEASVFWAPRNDPADWQHLTTFTVSLGVSGEVRPDGTYGADKSIENHGFPGQWDAITGTARNGRLPSAANKVDDLWHAGINGRGGYYSANNPEALRESFKQIVNAVSNVAKKSAAAVAPAFNTGSANSDRMAFQARFNSADWSGDLLAFHVSGGASAGPCRDKPRGDLCEDTDDPVWSAEEALRLHLNPQTRVLATATADFADTAQEDGVIRTVVDYERVALKWGDLASVRSVDSDDFQALLRSVEVDDVVGEDGAVDTVATENARLLKGQAIIDYIRGSDEYEGPRQAGASSSYVFRVRNKKLGDIIRSGPVVVGAPNRVFNDPTYVAYRNLAANRARRDLVYVGANDGILHAFDALTGSEVFGYVPRPLLGKLALLAEPGYGSVPAHANFVDGPIAEGDAYFAGGAETDVPAGWHPVLVGAMGLGAQGVYAIRSPEDAEVDPAAIHLWDFTDQHDSDMGYVFGKPAIVRVLMAGNDEPKWVAVFGNGINSSAADGRRAAGCDAGENDPCGHAVLYVVDMEKGTLIAKLDTGWGRAQDPDATRVGTAREPNGLGQPYVIGRVMTDEDGGQIGWGDPIATMAYAADLFGNVWRFDLNRLEEGETGRGATLVFSAGSKQPITAPLAVAPHPTGLGTLLLFGTGRYFSLADVSQTATQTFYGIWDKGEPGNSSVPRVANDDRLLVQRFLKTNVRVDSSDSEASVAASYGRISTRNAVDWSANTGWRLDLLEPDNTQKGERVVSAPQIRGDRVVFVSIIPESQPCKSGGSSWINAVSYSSGGALDETPFDYDRSGTFDTQDLLKTDTDPAVAGTSIRVAGADGIYSGPAALPLVGGDTKTMVSTSEGDLIGLLESSVLRWRVWQQIQ